MLAMKVRNVAALAVLNILELENRMQFNKCLQRRLIMKQKILVVEDDATSTEIIRINLLHQGYDLTFVTSGKDAYDIALQQIPDLILMDVKMPGWDGFETCRVLSQTRY